MEPLVIYPAIDLLEGRCVRLQQGRFDAVTAYSEDPVAIAQRWQSEGAHWLHIVDLDGARTGRPGPKNQEAVRRIIAQIGLPIQFGGGVRSEEAVDRMLNIGVTRVVVGPAAFTDPGPAQNLLAAYGDHLAVGVDARAGIVAMKGWQESAGERVDTFVLRMVEQGAKRFIFTDIARDGMLQGVNVVALDELAAAIPQIPVIASGGVTTLSDIDALLRLQSTRTNLTGVIIGKALYAGSVSLGEILERISLSAPGFEESP